MDNNIDLKNADAEMTELINKDPELSKTRIYISAAPDNYLAFTVERAPENTQDWIDILENVVGFLKSPIGEHQERYL